MSASNDPDAGSAGPVSGLPFAVSPSFRYVSAVAVLALLLVGFAGPIASLGILVIAALLTASLARPMLAVTIYIAIVVTNAADVATDFHGAPPLGGLLVPGLLLLLLIRRAYELESLSTSAIIIVPAAAYVSTASFGLLWVEDPLPTIEAVSELIKNMVIVIVICGFLTSIERLRMAYFCIGIAATGLAALSVFQYASGAFDSTFLGFATASVKNIVSSIDSWRLQGPMPDPNYFGQLLVMTLPIAASMVFVARSKILRVVGIVGTPLIVAAVFLTFSRGALVGLAGSFIVAVLLTRQRFLLALTVIFAALVLMLTSPGMVIDRIVPVFDAIGSLISGSQMIGDPALAQRFSVLQGGILMIKDHPVLGVGAGQFSNLYPIYALQGGLDVGAPANAHNSYLELAAEQGLFGLLVFIAVTVAIMAAGLSAVRRFRNSGHTGEAALVIGLLLALFGYLVTALFLHDDYSRVFWLSASLVIAAFSISMRTGFPVTQRSD